MVVWCSFRLQMFAGSLEFSIFILICPTTLIHVHSVYFFIFYSLRVLLGQRRMEHVARLVGL